ncbi:MAG: hypothetical protein WA947_21305 [Phormidesmis sp.]
MATEQRVRVIIFLAEPDDIDEQEWRKAAAKNPSFAFLQDAEEDIYALYGGQPFSHEGQSRFDSVSV